MGVVEDAQQAVGGGEVGGFAQQRQRLLAAAVEHPGAQAEQLDVQAAELHALRQRRRRAPGRRRHGASPAPRWRRGRAPLRAAARRCGARAALAARPARPAGRRSGRTGRGRSRRGSGARAGAPARPGWRCAAAAGGGRRRPHPSRPAARARGSRRPRPRRCAPSCGSRAARFREAAAFQDVEPVREQRAGLAGSSRSQIAAASSAASMQVNGLRRPRSPSARASVGRSSFSASSTWPSHRYDRPTMKSPQRPR